MRNIVAKNNHNRAAIHLDRSKEPQQTVDEGLLDYYAENAENVAQRVYDNREVKLFVDGEEIRPVTHYTDMVLKREPLSEEDKKHRILRVELVFTPKPSAELAALLDSFLKR